MGRKALKKLTKHSSRKLKNRYFFKARQISFRYLPDTLFLIIKSYLSYRWNSPYVSAFLTIIKKAFDYFRKKKKGRDAP